MRSSKKRNGRATSYCTGFSMGLTVMIALTLLVSVILAKLMATEKLHDNEIGYYVMFSLTAIAFIGASVSAAKIKHRIHVVCFSSGMLYWAALIALTLLVFGGEYGAVLETGGLIMLGSVLAIMPISVGRKAHSKRRVAF